MDITNVKVGLIPAALGVVTIVGWIITTVVYAKDMEADVAAQDQRIEQLLTVVEAQNKAAAADRKESRKLQTKVSNLITELRVTGVVSETAAAEEAPEE